MLTSVPKLNYTELSVHNCKWINKNNNYYDSNIHKLIFLQKFFKKHLLIKKILNISIQIIPIWWDPQCKGGFFHKKSMKDMLNEFNN